MQCTNFIGSVTDQRLRSLNAKASAIAQATTNGADDQETICATDTHNNDYTSFHDNPWFFRGNNITRMFKDYQSVVHGLINKYTTLPLELYLNELAALTHILVLNKHQHSSIVMKAFLAELLDELIELLPSESMNYNLDFNDQHYMTLTRTITNLSMSSTTREQAILELTAMSADMEYSPRRLIRGITNLIQKLPNTPLKDSNDVSEIEIWSTYFDPLLLCLICDPNRLVHLCWANVIPTEGGKSRPDAIIAKKQQLEYEGSIGHGEVKVNQGNASKYLLCMDTFHLAVFNKNAIDVNKLNGLLAFQIRGFNDTFFVSRLVTNGIYAFFEIACLRFP
ncbi:hypothetical protein G6F46_012196 [Rhizopus delemar]|nr:hypothetical protein G6F46_012196 [Rhizopus delemar]